MLTKLCIDDKVLVRRYSINRISLVSISETIIWKIRKLVYIKRYRLVSFRTY